ncbi:YceI family protein [Terrimonas alba]|jgi:polyisoprenoid-binding protein YceI|uniref:YceI family protein n=1 Tax=Terrimonas alba TaxID=3349636 RepID=UPI0035F33A8E
MDEIIQKTLWAIDPVHSKIRFDAKYLMMTSVSGWFRELEGTVTSSNEDFSNCGINLTLYTHSIFTGIEERDNHLKSADFFESKKYPTIQFKSSTVNVDKNNIHITGTLTIKEVTQEINFNARYLGSAPDPRGNIKAGFEMDAVFDRKDFNISYNEFFDRQGILISDQVWVHADIQLLKLN